MMRTEQLQSAAPAERARAKEQFVASLRGELDSVLKFLQAKEEHLASTKRIDPTSGEFHAVEILQFARYQPAADLFVHLLDTRRTDYSAESDEYAADYGFFPFAAAAVAVGMPAVPGLVKELGTADVATTQFQLSCLVLREILGEELALALLAIAAKKIDPPRQAKASEIMRLKPADWEAALCSDYKLK